MNYKYLIFSGYNIWGKHELTKEYFVRAVQRGDYIVNTIDATFFDKDDNAWKAIEGDNDED